MVILASLLNPNLFSSLPNPPATSNPTLHHHQTPIPIPKYPPPKPPSTPNLNNPAFKTFHSRSKFYKPIKRGSVISSDGDRSVFVGDSGVSYQLPYCHSRAGFLPFAHPTILQKPTLNLCFPRSLSHFLKKASRLTLREAGSGFDVAVDLSNANVAGPFPTVLCRLTGLKFISMYNNSINGTLPDELSTCQRLVHLDLAQNYLSGKLPESLCNLPELRYLDFTGNNFSGDIPASLVNFRNLKLFCWLIISSERHSGFPPRDGGGRDGVGLIRGGW